MKIIQLIKNKFREFRDTKYLKRYITEMNTFYVVSNAYLTFLDREVLNLKYNEELPIKRKYIHSVTLYSFPNIMVNKVQLKHTKIRGVEVVKSTRYKEFNNIREFIEEVTDFLHERDPIGPWQAQ